MNELRQELHDFSEHIICYGEGWNMYSSNMTDRMAHMGNKKVLPSIGFFNDTFRETIKGATFKAKEKGYCTGDAHNLDVVKEVIMGSAFNSFKFKYTSQSINYVECHDNLTFFDKYKQITEDLEEIRKREKLATAMVLLSQGVPFLHSGQEFFRTKKGVENSYNAEDAINLIDWERREQFADDVEFVKNLISIRKAFNCFKLKSTSELEQYLELLVLNSSSIMVHYNDTCDLLIIFKPSVVEETVIIPEEYEVFLTSTGNYEIKPESEYLLKDIGTYIFKKEVK